MERTDQPQPCEPRGSNPTSRDKQAADDDVASKEAKRNAYLLQLRNELLAEMSDSDDDLHIQPTTRTTSFKNPFKQKEAEPQPKVPEPQPAAKAKSLEGALATRHDTQQTADLDDEGPDGLLSEAELVLLGRVRRLVEASTPKPKKNSIVRPEIVPPEKPPSIFPSRGTPTRHDGEDRSSTAKPPMPYDKGLRRRRRQNCTHEHEHDGEECDDSPRSDAGSGQAHDQEPPTKEFNAHQEVQRTSHNGLQIRSQVVPKRHVRSLPGRYSALDSDEEEEWFRQYDKEQAKRKAQREAQGTNGSNGWSTVAHGIANGLQQMLPSDAFGQPGQQPAHRGQQSGYLGYHGVPNYRLPPQIYPTLQSQQQQLQQHQQHIQQLQEEVLQLKQAFQQLRLQPL